LPALSFIRTVALIWVDKISLILFQLECIPLSFSLLQIVKDIIKSPGKGPINSPGKNVNLPPKNREEVRIKCWGSTLG